MNKKIKNNRGFTLIELLAVIVILAIILVIVVPKVFDTIDSSKQKALLNSAKGVKKAWETKKMSSQLSGVDSGLGEPIADSYRCITSSEATILGLSPNDYNIADYEEGVFDGIIYINQCSLIGEIVDEYNNGRTGEIEIILIAKPGGSLYVGDGTKQVMYASSLGAKGWNGKCESLLRISSDNMSCEFE